MVPTLDPDTLSEIDTALAQAASGMAKAGKARSQADHRHIAARGQILRQRQVIADRRNDADAFIALEREIAPGQEDRLSIAQRLLAAGRAQEALDWIRREQEAGLRIVTRADLIAGFDPRGPDRARKALEIEILDALGRREEAQALRWALFERDLDAPMLRAYLAKLPDFEDEEALLRALDHAEAYGNPHRALAFLVGWPDLPGPPGWSKRSARSGWASTIPCSRRPRRPWSRITRSPRRSCIAACSTASSNPAAAPPMRMAPDTCWNSTVSPTAWPQVPSIRRRAPTGRAAAGPWPQARLLGAAAGLRFFKPYHRATRERARGLPSLRNDGAAIIRLRLA